MEVTIVDWAIPVVLCVLTLYANSKLTDKQIRAERENRRGKLKLTVSIGIRSGQAGEQIEARLTNVGLSPLTYQDAILTTNRRTADGWMMEFGGSRPPENGDRIGKTLMPDVTDVVIFPFEAPPVQVLRSAASEGVRPVVVVRDTRGGELARAELWCVPRSLHDETE